MVGRMFKRFLVAGTTITEMWCARRRMRFSRERLEQFQSQRIQSHLQFVVAHSEYYRELFRGHDLADWQSLPTTDKRSMMTNFGSFNTLGVSREEALQVAKSAEQSRDFRPTIRGATVGLSSGSTGNYSLFLSSTRENATFIGLALARLLRGRLTEPHRIAFFHRAHSNLYQGLNSGRRRYAFFDLSRQLETHFAALEQLQPTQIIGPPFVLRRLGEAMRCSKLSIAPRALLSVAEVLTDADRDKIESDFHLQLDEAYIATEGFIAATCPFGSLHVNEDCLVMQREWLDRESGRFVPIITDFRRRVQPMIRYRLDDVLVADPTACKCGSVFTKLKRIEGRCDDVLVFRGSDGSLRRIFPDFVRQAMYNASEQLRDYRVIQNAVDQLQVTIDAEQAYRSECERAARGSLDALFVGERCCCPIVTIEFAEHPLDSCGPTKVRRVVRNFATELT